MGVGSILLLALETLDALDDMHAGERAFRGEECHRVLRHLPRHRLADLERDVEIAEYRKVLEQCIQYRDKIRESVA